MFVVHVKIYYVGNPENQKAMYGAVKNKKPKLSINKVRFPKVDSHESCMELVKDDCELRTKRGRSCKIIGHADNNGISLDYITQTGGIYKGELRIKTLGDII